MNKPLYKTFELPDYKSIVIVGDIHGDFNLLVHKACVQCQIHDTLIN